VAFGIGTETSGSIVSPSRECGLSALRPTFGRVSRHGGMVLGWSRDRVGPICRTIEDCAMVFNTIHGADEKDTSTITAPFQFDRKIKLESLRIGIDANAPKEFVDKLRELASKPHRGSPLSSPPVEPGEEDEPISMRLPGHRIDANGLEAKRINPRGPSASGPSAWMP